MTTVRQRINSQHPYLVPFGGYDASDRAIQETFRRHLPGRELLSVPSSTGLPEMFAGNVYELRGGSVPREPMHVRVAARSGYRSAAAVVLIIEEYLRLAREPPEELLARAALCWMEDLVRAVKGRPLRSSGDRK